MRLRRRATATAVLALLSIHAKVQAMPFSDRITLPSGEKIFVTGHNLAWINFGNDVGDTPLNATAFEAAMKAVSDSGGNTMRVWLSTNGANDPKFGACPAWAPRPSPTSSRCCPSPRRTRCSSCRCC